MKKLIVIGLALLIGACAMFQSEQQVQDKQRMYQFMYCSAVHEQLGDIAAQENKIKPSQFTQEDMLNWYNISGSEAQYAMHMYYKLNLEHPMDIAKYNALYEKTKKIMTLPGLADMMGVGDAITQAHKDVGSVLAKTGTAGILDEVNYDLINSKLDGKCMEAYSDYTNDMSLLMSLSPEATVAARTAGSCLGVTDALSYISVSQGRPALAKAMAFHSGIMSTFLYAYINDENAEDAYDRITTKSDAIYNGMMSNKDLVKEVGDCQTVYSVANQYTIANVLAQPAQ